MYDTILDSFAQAIALSVVSLGAIDADDAIYGIETVADTAMHSGQITRQEWCELIETCWQMHGHHMHQFQDAA